MENKGIIKGRLFTMKKDHLDNNDIMPAFFAKRATKKVAKEKIFNNLRLKNPNDFGSNFDKSEILLPGKYFATEFQEETAVWGIIGQGFKAIISNHFGPNFYKYAVDNGLLPVKLTEPDLDYLQALDQKVKLTIDLNNQQVILKDKVFNFNIRPNDKNKLISGKNTLEQSLDYQDLIEAYEQKWDLFYQV